MKKLNSIAVIALVLVFSFQAFADDFRLTNKRFALGAISLCALNETLQKEDGLTIYVLGDQDVAEELLIFKNQNVGFPQLTEISYGENLPAVVPDVLLVCDESKLEAAKEYCRENSVFSITNSTEACKNGVSVAIVAKLPITLEHHYSMSTVYATINKSSLFSEGMTLNPQIWDVAKTIEESGFEKELAYIQLF